MTLASSVMLANDPHAAPPADSIARECRRVLAEGSKTFRFAGRFLPPDRLDDAAVVYAWCRLVDDLADEAESPETAIRDLTQMRAELQGAAPPRALVAAFRERMDAHPWALHAADELITGVLSDQDAVRIASDDELIQYGYRVASTVGLMMCAVLGVHDERAFPHAVDLGIAMQITNICRDVREDAERGRVYLPADRLRAVGATPEMLLEGAPPRESVARVVGDLLDLADRYYRSADDGMRWIPIRARLAIVVASRVYRAIGQKLRRSGCDAWQGRTVVSSAEKGLWAARAMGAALGPRIAGYGRRCPHDAPLHTALVGLPGANPRLLEGPSPEDAVVG
jgi:phytoene synthase